MAADPTEVIGRNARRGLLRAFGAAAGVAVAAAAPGPAVAQRADQVPAKDARKENDAARRAARYQETPHVQAFYRTNRYEQ